MKLFSIKFLVSFLILIVMFYGLSFKTAEAGGAVSVANTVVNFALGVGEVAVGTLTNDSNLTDSGRCRLGIGTSVCSSGSGGSATGLGGTPSITGGGGGGGGGSNNPKGYLDGADCNVISGWACDADDYNQSLNVHLYKDGPAGSGTGITSSITANQSREPAVGA
ncbi:MAG: hypothetical protein HYW71_01715, partial [Candidatus Niyogibacteria bacterium]|nr:hypothetical protein [Candidatus Niyogibacteria bacterium]